MKTVILFLSLFFTVVFSTQSQNQQEKVRFGIKAGLSVSHINFSKGSPPPKTPIETSWNQGPNLGFLMVVALPFAKSLYIQPEYLFSRKGGEAKDKGRNYRLDYFNLPVLLRWEMSRRVSLLAGPEFGMVINSEEEVLATETTREVPIEERSIAGTFGMEIELWRSFAVGARYMHGLNHIGLGDQLTVQEFKFETFQFSVICRL